MLKRALFVLWMLSFFSIPAFGQSTTVSGTVTDSGAQLWNNGTYSFNFVPNPQYPNSIYTWTGGAFNSNAPINGSLSGTGTYSVSIPSNASISPINSQWRVTFCPQATASNGCYTTPATTIFGATQTLNATPPAVTVNAAQNVVPLAYADSEIVGAVVGTSYYNSVLASARVCTAVSAGTCSTWASSGGAIGGLQNSNSTWYVSTNCTGYTYCTQINADGKYAVDATTTSGSSTVTCPNNDCNFIAADVGKTVWATTTGVGAGIGLYAYTTYACPITTIATVNSAQSITLTAANDCTQNLTASAVLVWGHKDGAALATMSTSIGCQPVNVTPGFILLDQPILNALPTSCNRALSASLGPPNIGPLQGAAGTIFIITPDFNWSACPVEVGAQQPVCIGWGVGVVRNISIWGTGLTSASNANCPTNKIVFEASEAFAVEEMGVCPGAVGVEGIELDSTDAALEDGGSISNGQYACVAYGASAMVSNRNDCNNAAGAGTGLWVTSNAQLFDISSYPLINVKVDGILQTRGAHLGSTAGLSAVNVSSGGSWYSAGDYLNVDTGSTAGTGLTINATGLVQSLNTKFSSTGTVISNAGLFLDLGGNIISGGTPTTVVGGQWGGTQVLRGACTGAFTASATIGLFNLGQFATPTCTSTTTGVGYVTGLKNGVYGTLRNLYVLTGTGGVNASDGVVTVLRNGATTTITCTVGTATTCSDTTHTVALQAEDIISVQVVTQAATTLNAMSATVLVW